MRFGPELSTHPSSVQVLVRFFLRLAILGAMASGGKYGFAPALKGLLMLVVVFCALVAAMKREPLLAPVLTHWDEAAAYGMLVYFLPAGPNG